MISRWNALLLITLALAVLPVSRAQSSPPATSAKIDYSQEPAIIEEMASKIAFENDGNSNREQVARIHVQTDAGVQTWGLLRFPFQSATQTLEIDYVRVHKVDGSTVITPPDNVQDLDSEITRSAPFYSDLREKHVAVKGLAKGDTLEYAAHWHSTKPLIPGQFWFEYNFSHDGIVLDERLEIKVPADRAVKVKGPQATQSITTAPGSRTYTWTYSHLQSAKEPGSDQKKLTEAARGLLPPEDVQISSFQSWDEVGRWYWGLQKERIEPTPAIRAKAAELTKGMTDDDAKLRAIYSFVSTQYRYIGIAFGIGRYQPHAADDVLTNNYGDCKDKHTLLASLLQAAGITLYPALINSNQKLDPDIPSPAQFDHIIGYLPPDKNGGNKNAVWLDTTVEVSPVGYLVTRLRDKPALVMAGDKSIQLMTTPSDSPFANTETFKIEGKLGADGTFDARVEDTSRGDTEVVIRSAFRRVAQPQWKDLVQQISYGMGFAGTVSDIKASTPEAIAEPFDFSYSYNRKDYPDWKSDQRFTVPGAPLFLPPLRDDAVYPIWLGTPMEIVSDSKVELPAGYAPQIPANVDLKYDFAEYHASYSQDHGALIAKRHLLTKMREIPVAEFDAYRTFNKNLQNDVNQYVMTSSSTPSPVPVPPFPSEPTSPVPGGSLSLMREAAKLPESDSAAANQLESDARKLVKTDSSAALSALQRAVEVDPKFTRVWLELAAIYMAKAYSDSALDACRKAVESDPKQLLARRMYVSILVLLHRNDEAIDALRDAVKVSPNDPETNAALGSLLVAQRRYSEAVPLMETAAKNDNSPLAQARLGSVYLLADERDKAAATFAKLAEIDPKGTTFNDAAYEMANADLKLPLALDYAKKAVHSAEEDSQKIELTNMTVPDLKKIFRVAAYWDTLGWVDERVSSFEQAELYLRASWRLTQDGVVAGHLCHLYKREHRDELAIQMCGMAISRMSMSQQLGVSQFQTELAAAKENLRMLTQKKAEAKSTSEGSDAVIRERTFKLPRFLPGTESAEFFVLFASDGKSKKFKVEDVKFISGSDKMKLQGKQVKTIDFNVPAPDETPTRFVRRGILGCYQYSGCSFVLLDPASVTSLN